MDFSPIGHVRSRRLDQVGNAHDHCPSVLFVVCYRNDQGSVVFGALGRLWTRRIGVGSIGALATPVAALVRGMELFGSAMVFIGDRRRRLWREVSRRLDQVDAGHGRQRP
jgi:hypothetical protein